MTKLNRVLHEKNRELNEAKLKYIEETREVLDTYNITKRGIELKYEAQIAAAEELDQLKKAQEAEQEALDEIRKNDELRAEKLKADELLERKKSIDTTMKEEFLKCWNGHEWIWDRAQPIIRRMREASSLQEFERLWTTITKNSGYF